MGGDKAEEDTRMGKEALELQRLRLRLLTLLYAMLIRKQCIETGERLGARQLINLIRGRSIDWSELLVGGAALIAAVEIPKIIAYLRGNSGHL